MKKLLIIILFTFGTSVATNPSQAKDSRSEETIGFGSGLIIGALAGGPFGAIIGAVSGIWIGEKVHKAEKTHALNLKIAKTEVLLQTFKKQIVAQNAALDESQLLLANQHVALQRVSVNNQLLTGLQIDLMFRTNSAQLESRAIDKIVPLILMLNQFPQLELQLIGHGDALGTDAGNTEVAYQRILTVQQSFINAGIEQQRLHLLNSGRSQAIATIDDSDGRALDRRVRIQFMQAISQPKLALQ